MPTATYTITDTNRDQFVGRLSPTVATGGNYPVDDDPLVGGPAATAEGAARTYATATDRFSVKNGLYAWDTSTLPDGTPWPAGSTLTAVSFQFYCTSRDNANSLALTADWFAWAGGGNAADFTSTPGTDALASHLVSLLTINATNTVPLDNTTGVNRSGLTRLRTHITQRAADAAPTGPNSVGTAMVGHANHAPRLVLSYGPNAPTGLSATAHTL